jgi:hypothetical protein
MRIHARTSFALLALALVLAIAVCPRAAAAQTQIVAGHKGAVGLGLLGAEIGLVVPALAGLDQAWALAVFPVVGAVGGAVGGHYLTDAPNRRVGAVVLLSLGVAMVIPAALITRAALAFDPDEDRVDPLERAARAGPGLLRLADGALFLAAPGITYVPPTPLAIAPFEDAPAELQVPLLSGVF